MDIIKIDVREIRLGDVHWIDLAQHRDRWRALTNNSNDTSGPTNCREFLEKYFVAYHSVR